MPPVLCYPIAALVVGMLYYSWRDLYHRRCQSPRFLRERVAYMLWVVANR